MLKISTFLLTFLLFFSNISIAKEATAHKVEVDALEARPKSRQVCEEFIAKALWTTNKIGESAGRSPREPPQLYEQLSKEGGDNLIGYLSIERDRPIDQSTYIYVKFAVEEFKKSGVKYITLHLNTPGGEVMSALKIADLLKKVQVEDKIPVIAFIDTWAVSAGAMLAYASKHIVIVKSSIMGAAEPVFAGKEGKMVTASEKINSALRAEFANLANFFGRDPLLAEAMVDKDIILVKRGNRIIQLKEEDEMLSSDSVISRKGKLLTLNAKELIEYGVASFELSSASLSPITREEMKQGKWPLSKSLLAQLPLLKEIPNAYFISYKDFKVRFFSLLTHPVISSLLFIGLIIGFYIEITTPGFGVFGAIALTCLALIFLSSFAVYAITWLEIILLLIGAGLLLLEFFVIPGFGITGILGGIFILFGIIALLLPLEGSKIINFDISPLFFKNILMRLAYLAGGLVLSFVIISVLARFLSRRFLSFSKLVLKGEQEGFVSAGPRENWPEVGDVGTTETPLRPAGKIRVNDTIYDAMTDGDYIEMEKTVQIIRVEGNKVVVIQK